MSSNDKLLTERTVKGMIHCAAFCLDCEWEEGWPEAGRAATAHVKRTGHIVRVEQAYSYTVKHRGR